MLEHQAHKVSAQKGGWFEKMGLPSEFTVNSIHTQGIEQLGSGLHVEALSEDGVVEAISVPGKRFVLGTQWHPEGDWTLNSASQKIFETFGQAIRS
jgi:putative glutamine amidotransferase